MTRAALAAAVLLAPLPAPAPVLADSDLTGLLATAFLPRTEDPALHEWAHVRAAFQVSFSGGDCGPDSLTHDGWTTAEVLACNYDGPERTVQQWLGSPPHAAILLDPTLTLIGCGSAPGNDGATFYACVLSAGVGVTTEPTPALIPPAATPVPPPLVPLLPDTRMRP